MMLSFTPVTVTVCGVSQFAEVKVKGLFTVASPISEEVIAITTSLVGCASRTTVKVSVVPDSSTPVDPLVSVTVKPAISLSVVVADTVWSTTSSNSSVVLSSTIEIVNVEV